LSEKLVQEKYNFILSRPYKPSNHEGLDMFYDKNTFIKLYKNHNITLSEGKIYFIIKKLYGLKEGSFDLHQDTQLYNLTSSDLYCVLSDCAVYKEENENKLFVKNGTSLEELL
tara:strand:- start:13 stop:351 length:339 start_codon:yes stop_codon:yes gene_type:complete